MDEAVLPSGGRIAVEHEVLRLISDPADPDPGHAHVIAVETAAEAAPRRWKLTEFVRAVRVGERFYVVDGTERADVQPSVCDRCARVTIAVLPADGPR